MSRRLLAIAAAALLPLSIHAADVPKEGNDTFTADWVITSSNTIQQGNRFLNIYELNGVTRNDAGEPMFHLFGRRCLGVYESIGGERNDLGTCTYTDKDGDQIFQHYPTGKVIDGHGTAELIGGTGKYTGITGTIEYFEGMTGMIKADDKMLRGSVLHKVMWKLP